MAILDEFDLRLLRMLQECPDATVADLAEGIGLSQTPCWRRLKRLEAEGYVSHRAVILDARKLGFSINAFANVRLGRHDEATLDAFESEVLRHPEIVECFSMTGDSDFTLRVMARTIEDYEQFLKKILLHLPGVASVNTSFALKSVLVRTNCPI